MSSAVATPTSATLQTRPIDAREKAQISSELGHVTEDVLLACNVLAALQAQIAAHGGGGGARAAFKIDGGHATYFVLSVRSVRKFTSNDAEQIRQLSQRCFDVIVNFARQRVSVHVARASHAGMDRRDVAYAAPERRKRRQLDIDWAAGHVTDADDQRRLTDIVDDVYNYENCMPSVTMFFDHVAGNKQQLSRTGAPGNYVAMLKQQQQLAGGGGGGAAVADDDASASEASCMTSEQTLALAQDSCGFAVCFLGMPECKFGTFSAFLQARYGKTMVPLVYASFAPDYAGGADGGGMLVINVRKTLSDATKAQHTLSNVTKAPKPPVRRKKQQAKRAKFT